MTPQEDIPSAPTDIDVPLKERPNTPNLTPAEDKARTRVVLMARARAYQKQGLSRAEISRRLGVARATVTKWIKPDPRTAKQKAVTVEQKAGRAARIAAKKDAVADQRAEEALAKLDEVAEEPINALDRTVIEEEANMKAIADAQVTVADQYQHYLAAAGIRLMRDAMPNMAAPRTVKDLSVLDQIIRRSLGLNTQGGGGNSSTRIDISILNSKDEDTSTTRPKLQREILVTASEA